MGGVWESERSRILALGTRACHVTVSFLAKQSWGGEVRGMAEV